VKWIYKTSALGELREGEIVFGSASKKVGFMRLGILVNEAVLDMTTLVLIIVTYMAL
jgi:hypothetical protein